MATIMYPDGTSQQVQPLNGRVFKLAQLNDIVGSDVEIVNTRDGRIMVINEEGKLLGLPRNEQATAIAGLPTPEERIERMRQAEALGFKVFIFGDPTVPDYIAGTVLICERREIE